MAYLMSLLVVAGAVFMLAAIAARTLPPARRMARSAQDMKVAITEHTGLLAARVAALRMEWDRRRSGRADSSSM